MLEVEVPTPFGQPVQEIPLSEAPLIAVVAQIRFPPIASIAREDFIGPFQELVRGDFPVLRQERAANLFLTADGAKSVADAPPVWRFLDKASSPAWKLSLSSSFVALDTSEYESRGDFLRRLRAVLNALSETVGPSTVDRIGIRYVDRVLLDQGGAELANLVKAEVVGVATIDAGNAAELIHSISDTEFHVDEAILRARWGIVPPDAQLDPAHGSAIDSTSWILDLDMYSTSSRNFDVDELVGTTETYATSIYRFFRWAARSELLRRYGGDV